MNLSCQPDTYIRIALLDSAEVPGRNNLTQDISFLSFSALIVVLSPDYFHRKINTCTVGITLGVIFSFLERGQ